MQQQDPEPDRGTGDDIDHRLDVDSIVGNVVQAGHIRGGIHVHHPPSTPEADRSTPRQLPAATPIFVNREDQVEQLWQHLAEPEVPRPHPVIAIIGSGGVGKTALALHWLHRIRDRFTDGDLYCNLQGYGTGQPLPAATVLERMLTGLGVPPDRIPFQLDDRAALYRSKIAGRKLLILLDNAANAGQVRPLIPGALGPLLVVTSRSRMPSLAVREGVQYVHVDVLDEPEAIALVHEVTDTSRRSDSADEVTELVQLCAHLPLALRIAAERAVARPHMRLAELLDDLRDTSGLWDALSVEDGPDTDDVRTVFAWSYRALPETAAWIFRVIGLHPGQDVSLPAIAAAAGVPYRAARRATDLLVGAFLLDHTNGARFQMHDLLRAYANAESRTHDTGPVLHAVLDRMFCWYAGTTDNAATLLSSEVRLLTDLPTAPGVEPATFPDAAAARDWFEAERRNLLAVARLADVSDQPAHALALALAASLIYMHYFHFDDWSEASAIAVRAAASLRDSTAIAVAAENRGKFLLRRGLYDHAHTAFTQAQESYTAAGNPQGEAEAANSLGLTCLRTRRLDEAARLFDAAAAAFDAHGEHRWAAISRSNLAEAHIELNQSSTARGELQPLLSYFTEHGDKGMQGNALWLIAWACRGDGDTAGAAIAIEQALAIAEIAQNSVWEGFWLIEAARIDLARSEPAAAIEHCQLAAALQRQIGDKSREAQALHCTGEALRLLDRAEEAHALFAQAAHQFSDAGERWHEGLARVAAADALASLGQSDAEHEQLQTALSCLDSFTDPQARRVQQNLRTRLQ